MSFHAQFRTEEAIKTAKLLQTHFPAQRFALGVICVILHQIEMIFGKRSSLASGRHVSWIIHLKGTMRTPVRVNYGAFYFEESLRKRRLFHLAWLYSSKAKSPCEDKHNIRSRRPCELQSGRTGGNRSVLPEFPRTFPRGIWLLLISLYPPKRRQVSLKETSRRRRSVCGLNTSTMASTTCTRFTDEHQLYEELGKWVLEYLHQVFCSLLWYFLPLLNGRSSPVSTFVQFTRAVATSHRFPFTKSLRLLYILQASRWF